jgi:predicted GNAT family N-acyltransferase
MIVLNEYIYLQIMIVRLIDYASHEYADMIDLRMEVLLNPIGIPRSYINTDLEKEHLLIGAFENDKLIGCCILTPIDSGLIQLRQMAVSVEHQKKSIGSQILSFAESTAEKKGYHVMMMHARDAVMEFYRKNGYEIKGRQFFEVGIPNNRLKKQLK